jgi:hypothetical protein
MVLAFLDPNLNRITTREIDHHGTDLLQEVESQKAFVSAAENSMGESAKSPNEFVVVGSGSSLRFSSPLSLIRSSHRSQRLLLWQSRHLVDSLLTTDFVTNVSEKGE